MLRTNLSTKPFYNERAVLLVLAAATALVVALTAFNAIQIARFSRQQASLSSLAASNETRARELRANASTVRAGIDPKQLESVAAAAREANTLIGQRLFSWTDLLNRLETTLPDDVRITSMRPTVEKDGSVIIAMTVVGRSVEEIAHFMQNLEGSGAFADVFIREDVANEEGLREAALEGRYLAK